jgi:hypothetical protein
MAAKASEGATNRFVRIPKKPGASPVAAGVASVVMSSSSRRGRYS